MRRAIVPAGIRLATRGAAILAAAGVLSITGFLATADAQITPPSNTATIGTPANAGPTQPPAATQGGQKPTRIFDKPLDLTVVDQIIVCGTTRDSKKQTICIGDSPATTPLEPVGQVTELVGNRQSICAKDETGFHCWQNSARFKKPVNELIGKASASDFKILYDRLCVRQPDNTVICHGTQRERWSPERDQYEAYTPESEVFGPFQDLRDFEISTQEICVLDREQVSCHPFSDVSPEDQSSPTLLPKRALKNPREIAMDFGTFCVADDLGVVCTKGSDVATVREVELDRTWLGVKNLDATYDSLCGEATDNIPRCVAFDLMTGQTANNLPRPVQAIIADPKFKILASKASGERVCLKLIQDGDVLSQFRCWTLGREEQVPAHLGEVKAFAIGVQFCVVGENGWVSCFSNGLYGQSPLPKAPDAAQYFRSCSWNSRRLVCDGNQVEQEVNNIARVVAVNQSPTVYNTCLLVEDINGVVDMRCFSAGMEELVRTQPHLSSRPTGFSLGYHYGCIYSDTEFQCWGDAPPGEPAPTLSSIKKVLFGDTVGCGLDKFGLVCWGDVKATGLTVPSTFGEPESVIDFGMGQRHICVLTSNGKVACWGANDMGQAEAPVLDQPDQIMASSFLTCATDKTGVWCWGLRSSSLGGNVTVTEGQ